MNRTCRVCGEKKDDSKFYRTYSYTRYICKKCENKQRQAWRVIRSKEMKARALEYLGSKCGRCGYSKSRYALEFNHLGKKLYEPTRMFQRSLSWKLIERELKNCELLCANCHREVTFKN